MLRKLLNAFVLIMLILQGVAQASVDVQPHPASMHCAQHDASKTDCPCCGDSWLGMAAGCATSCATFVAMSQPSLVVPAPCPQMQPAIALHWHASPSYLPLTPPPIA